MILKHRDDSYNVYQLLNISQTNTCGASREKQIATYRTGDNLEADYFDQNIHPLREIYV